MGTQNKRLAELTEALEMSVSQLAKSSGYTRQALYLLAGGKPSRGKRLHKAKIALVSYVENAYTDALEQAEATFQKRMDAIGVFFEAIQPPQEQLLNGKNVPDA